MPTTIENQNINEVTNNLSETIEMNEGMYLDAMKKEILNLKKLKKKIWILRKN